MLSLLIQILQYIKQIGYFGLLISYKTGQTIISGLNIVFNLVLQLNKNVTTLLWIAIEDFNVFLCDVFERVCHLVTIICSIFQNVLNCILLLVNTIKSGLFAILFGITETWNMLICAISKVISGFGEILMGIKYFVLLLGSGIWFAITIIPLFIVYSCTMFTYYTGCVVDEFINIIALTFNQCKLFLTAVLVFVTDVPLESLAGLTAGVCISYVMLKFHIILCRTLLSGLELIRRNIHNVRLRFIRRNQPIEESSSESEHTESSESEYEEEVQTSTSLNESRMCIICHERTKCILMLPCRHICVCHECNIRLRNYHRTCPICRGIIEKTMKVFV